MADPVIRLIRPADNKIIAGIIRASLKEFNANKPGTVYFDETTDHLSEVFEIGRSAYFILEEGNEIAGGAGFFPTTGLPAGTCELVKMYLSSSFRNKGYGSLLLQHCIEKAKENGYTKMYIETMPELKTAIAMYQKSGFTFLKGPLGNSGHTGCDVWMIKELCPPRQGEL